MQSDLDDEEKLMVELVEEYGIFKSHAVLRNPEERANTTTDFGSKGHVVVKLYSSHFIRCSG